jgi:hypothetical protein
MQGKLVQRCEHPINITESIDSVNQVAEKISHEAFSGRPVKLRTSQYQMLKEQEVVN